LLPGGEADATVLRRTVKTDPLPTSLVTVTSPPIMRASLRVIARPRPVASGRYGCPRQELPAKIEVDSG
jgi:hypothetical protein